MIWRGTLILALAVFCTAAYGAPGGKAEIERFNQHYLEMHQRMDTAGLLATWDDDGVDLMQGQMPLIGKQAITAWLDKVLAGIKGFKVTKQEMEFHDIRVAGDWASEWATEHQVVQPPGDKPPIETFGKFALVLQRDPAGEWKVVQEMWNSTPAPQSSTHSTSGK